MEPYLLSQKLQSLAQDIERIHMDLSQLSDLECIHKNKDKFLEIFKKLIEYDVLVDYQQKITSETTTLSLTDDEVTSTTLIEIQTENLHPEYKSETVDTTRSNSSTEDCDNQQENEPVSKLKIPKLKSNQTSAIDLGTTKESLAQNKKLAVDLNDKIFLIQQLFNHNAEAYTSCIDQLEKCETRDEANAYLSNEYHKRNWKNQDVAAQRLWTLVENALYVR